MSIHTFKILKLGEIFIILNGIGIISLPSTKIILRGLFRKGLEPRQN